MSQEFGNAHLAATIGGNGSLESLTNKAAGETYAVRGDEVEVVTDEGTFGSGRARAVGGGVWEFEVRGAKARVEYQPGNDRPWIKRRLVVTAGGRPLTLKKVVLGRTAFAQPPREFVNYETFWNAPTAAFLRWEKGGIFTGIENPFFQATCGGGRLEMAFEPGLILKEGERYESEWQFIGVYRNSGVMIADHNPRTSQGRRPRFRNPCGHVPLDRAEVRAMQRFAFDYLDMPDAFHFVLYNFFYPLPQMPAAGSAEEAVHRKMLDVFEQLGGDLIIFNPMHPYRRPEGRMDAYWELGPAGSAAEAIMKHAGSQGMKFGYYMGCARHGGEGNACALPFAPERPEWKKVDASGRVGAENCIACDEYADWFFAVQHNTIERYGLGLWSWDPGPGNGLFCHAENHGHLPGKGAYKGWRAATAMLRRIKEAHPGIYFQAYYGRKEHGLWGFKYFDQHESYWELGLWMCTMHPELHADRQNADGVRHQGWWNTMHRFHPSLLTHGMVHRFQEGVHDPALVKAWDALGWRYSLMSGLACAGSITTVILPEDLALAPGMAEFYRKWLAWARENARYAGHNIPFGSPVRPGGVDGWARIIGDHGFLFLCNPGPRPARITFGLDDEIGLEAPGRFALTELHPREGRRLVDAAHADGLFPAGDRVSAVVPAHEVMLLELSASTRAAAPAGRPAASPLPRMLDKWKTPTGRAFTFPRNEPAEALTLTTTFHAAGRIRDLLAQAAPPNIPDLERLIPKWRKDYPVENYAWARPDRLWLVLPFVDPDAVGLEAVALNGQPATLECQIFGRKIIHYADLTDLVAWDSPNTIELTFSALPANQFMGPYLDYPPDPSEAPADPEAAEVVYDGPLDSDTPRRCPAPGERAPKVTSFRMDPPYLKEWQETRFIVTVDAAPEELAAVMVSGPWCDMPMTHEPGTNQWVWTFRPGPRWTLIMDVGAYDAWAVTKTGLVGPAARLPLEWRF